MKIYRISNLNKDIIAYHGTNQDIDFFDSQYLGENTFAVSAREGFFFTEDKEEAKIYAEIASEKQPKNKKEYEAKMRALERLNKMYERTGNWKKAQETIEEWERFDKEWNEDRSGKRIYSVKLNINNPKIIDGRLLKNVGIVSDEIKKAKLEGHDGLMLEGIKDGYHMNTNHWVVFDAEQIKIIDIEDIE